MNEFDKDRISTILSKCEVHTLSFNHCINSRTLEFLDKISQSSDPNLVKFANQTMTMIIKMSKHLVSIDESYLKLALDLEIRYLNLASDSEF
jgi:hypothetical protein